MNKSFISLLCLCLLVIVPACRRECDSCGPCGKKRTKIVKRVDTKEVAECDADLEVEY